MDWPRFGSLRSLPFSSCNQSPSMFFLFNYPATSEFYTLSLHDALPISHDLAAGLAANLARGVPRQPAVGDLRDLHHLGRSEEHTSELQSLTNLVCRLLLEKKKRI